MANAQRSSFQARRHAVETFGSAARARRWWQRPCRVFGGQAPCEVARSPAGAERVIDLLMRIDHGLAS
jgi:uncharacterized protein (DUF2384 family)